MTDVLPDGDALLRLLLATGIVAAMALWEWRAPLRARSQPLWQRWVNHGGLLALGTLILRVILPFGLAGFAAFAEVRGWGLLNMLPLPGGLAVVAAIILLDLAIYAQHRAMHGWPWLWRLHRVHHSDTHIDVTTALRFHPLELLVSLGWKLVLIATLGAPPAAVLAFELILNGMAIFNHANVAIPPRIEPWLRRLVVTPDMHHIHHSTDRAETDSNFGFSLSLWDRLFGSYRGAAKVAQQAMPIGIGAFRSPGERTFGALLVQPFRA